MFQPGWNEVDMLNHRTTMQINKYGYRTCPYTNNQSGESIALIGDSFVFGLHLDERDTLCTALGNVLTRKHYGPFSIKNLGFPGTNFSSYLNVADYFANKGRTDLMLIEYLGPNDLLPYDSDYEIDSMRNSFLFKIIVLSFGQHNTANFLRLAGVIKYHNMNNRMYPSLFGKDVLALKKLTKKNRVVIISYNGGDAFLDYLEKEVKGLRVINLEVPRPGGGGDNSEYFIPNDGHPTGKANRLYAEQIADYIIKSGHTFSPIRFAR